MTTQFISVGIDVGSDFSFMSLALPDQTYIGKPFKIIHEKHDSLENAIEIIKKAEEQHNLKARIVLESTSFYHYPLFYYLTDRSFDTVVINPIISKKSTNMNIRKVHNDKFDSKKLAFIGLNRNLKTSIIPEKAIISLRNLIREYHNLVDERSKKVIKLSGILKISMPEYEHIFSKITTKASLALLEKYPCAKDILAAKKSTIIALIKKTSMSSNSYAKTTYDALKSTAQSAKTFGCYLPSNSLQIRTLIKFIKIYDEAICNIFNEITSLIKENSNKKFIKQIHLLDSIKGIGFISAATLMCEIGDFSVFRSPKQLVAYFGIDPSVIQSGNFKGSEVKMSKRGSSLARRILFIAAISSIGLTRNDVPNNEVLRTYYLEKCKSKPKMVALGAVMHKICFIIFSVLRNEKEFVIITPEEQIANYKQKHNKVA